MLLPLLLLLLLAATAVASIDIVVYGAVASVVVRCTGLLLT
jgi:hypothetical protein